MYIKHFVFYCTYICDGVSVTTLNQQTTVRITSSDFCFYFVIDVAWGKINLFIFGFIATADALLNVSIRISDRCTSVRVNMTTRILS